MSADERTESLRAADRANVWHPFTPMSVWLDDDAPIIERGEGSFLIDTDGRHYIDGPVYDAPVGLGGALLGSLLGDVPYDRYGADPNGMIARDGHVIKCKLTDDYDSRYGREMTHRVCY